ncbi:autoinducer binding domain-containing protein [Tepidamorphus sp. 3E244]|uniref:autoinducer binding domain-containing protein n=1 Tax=Tepidamorphus sp. 3E244 TaxID=3385498 RepID=UPI0038FCC35A
MRLEETIARVEAAQGLEELHGILDRYIQSMGFAEYSFIDNSRFGANDPLILNSIEEDFERDYRTNQFLDADPCLPLARTRNTPFTWGDIALPQKKGNRPPKALMVMEAASDYGYRNGLVIPFHYRDRFGAYFSSVCTLFWKDEPADFDRQLAEFRHEITLVLIYWAQQVIDISTRTATGSRLRSNGDTNPAGPLTEREQEVLLWAAQGKTSEDTAVILGISRETVETHIRASMAKLDAVNKTQAVVKAIFNRYIIP